MSNCRFLSYAPFLVYLIFDLLLFLFPFFFFAVVDMSRFLRIPNTESARVSKGPAIAEGEAIEPHVTEPLAPEVSIPKKTDLQRVVEKPDQRVLDARALKEKKKQNAPPRGSKKRPAGEAPGRRLKKAATPSVVDVSDSDASDATRSPSPLNVGLTNMGHLQTDDTEGLEHVAMDHQEDLAEGSHAGGGDGGDDNRGDNEGFNAGDDGEGDGGGGEYLSVPNPPNVEDLAHGGIYSLLHPICSFEKCSSVFV